MNHSLLVLQTVLAYALVILLCILLKKWHVVKEEDGPFLARLVTEVALPAVIFSALATHPITRSQWLLVLAILVAGLTSLGLAWLIGKLLKRPPTQVGALMLSSSFGSSALIGYPLIQYAFPHNPQALADAILLSEVGVGIPLFTICVVVAMHFGEATGKGQPFYQSLLTYLRSPIFLALAAGLLVSPLGLDPQRPILAPIFKTFDMVRAALPLLACLILGLQLKYRPARLIAPLIIVSAVIQLIFQPWLVSLQAGWYHLSAIQRQILVLEGAMPSAILPSVFAARYRCGPAICANIIFFHLLASVVTLPLVFATLGG
jgi:malate permease and related proteins